MCSQKDTNLKKYFVPCLFFKSWYCTRLESYEPLEIGIRVPKVRKHWSWVFLLPPPSLFHIFFIPRFEEGLNVPHVWRRKVYILWCLQHVYSRLQSTRTHPLSLPLIRRESCIRKDWTWRWRGFVRKGRFGKVLQSNVYDIKSNPTMTLYNGLWVFTSFQKLIEVMFSLGFGF